MSVLFIWLAIVVVANPPRIANCTANMSPQCAPCEGLGGIIPYGKTKDDIIIPACQVVGYPADVPNEQRVLALYPKYYSANFSGSYSSLALARPFDHNYYLVTGNYYYDADLTALHFENHQHIVDKNNKTSMNLVQGWHIKDNLATWGHKFIDYCYCMVPYKVNGTAIGPVKPDAFASATYVGREVLTVEYLNKQMTLDHWMLSFYHIWVDIETKLIVRTTNRQQRSGEDEEYIVTVYFNWNTEKPSSKHFTLPDVCGAWWEKPWDNCAKMNDTLLTSFVLSHV